MIKSKYPELERFEKNANVDRKNLEIVQKYIHNISLPCVKCHSLRLKVVNFHLIELVSLTQRVTLFCEKCHKTQYYTIMEEDLS